MRFRNRPLVPQRYLKPEENFDRLRVQGFSDSEVVVNCSYVRNDEDRVMVFTMTHEEAKDLADEIYAAIKSEVSYK